MIFLMFIGKSDLEVRADIKASIALTNCYSTLRYFPDYAFRAGA